MNLKTTLPHILFVTNLFIYSNGNAQVLAKYDAPVDTSLSNNILNMSLEEMMNVKIVSASRKEEKNFDSPSSSCVLTQQEIAVSGSTSIPDALKLCPGILVRELSNGTYDVSIRGGIDGYPAYNYSISNYSILVMIDNRPVFSSFQGGTFWQNLPVGLAEIERIEVVYGPSSPLYGPNAVSGVINIITKRPKDANEIYTNAQVQAGPQMVLGTAVVEKKIS